MTSAARSSGRTVALVLLLVIVTAATVAGGLAAGRSLRQAQVPLAPRAVAAGVEIPDAVRRATSVPTGGPAAATADASTDPGTPPSAAATAAALAGPLADPRLGGHVLVRVTDAPTGTELLGSDVSGTAAPASTTKITTAAAVLTNFDATDRITTRVVAGTTPGSVVLVGAGDPTLSAAPIGTPSPYANAARIAELAAAVKASLGTTAPSAVVVDDSLFSGPAVAPGWAPEDAPSLYGAAITAAMVDGGRDTPDALSRSAAPDLAAGQALANALGVPSAPVTLGNAPAGATTLGSVQSAPIGEITAQMLKESDNVLAECLARQVAIARSQPASFAGAAAAVAATLPAIGTGLVDGSGLSVDDRLSPTELTALLGQVTSTPRLAQISEMLPVGGWDGTLRNRYLTAPESAGAGRVRAKTGTLTSVSTLAGFVVTAGGRLLAFAVLADQVGPTYDDTLAAESALDAVAAALTTLP